LFAEQLFCKVDGTSELFPFKTYYIQKLKVLNAYNKNFGYRPSPPIYNILLEVKLLLIKNIYLLIL